MKVTKKVTFINIIDSILLYYLNYHISILYYPYLRLIFGYKRSTIKFLL